MIQTSKRRSFTLCFPVLVVFCAVLRCNAGMACQLDTAVHSTASKTVARCVCCVCCCAAANVSWGGPAWEARVAPPVITYLMAMNHEPVVNNGEVRG